MALNQHFTSLSANFRFEMMIFENGIKSYFTKKIRIDKN